MLSDVTLMITGGTGSFGNAVLRRFLDTNVREVRIFSRDEKKQDDMRKRYQHEKLKFVIGDVRDRESLTDAMHDVDYVFHAAALKQVPSCEFFPLEAVNTNVQGTANAIDAAHRTGVRKMICLSTDKAVYPINAMGTSKAMMEKVVTAKARTIDPDRMTLCATRYGNVMASRGSVIPLFVRQIMNGEPITITDPNMTRYMMTLDHAVDLVLFGYQNGNTGDIFVQKAPAATITVLAQALLELFEKPDHEIKILGTRHGEKKHETLLSREELAKAIDLGEYYRVPADMRDLNYGKYVEKGEEHISEAEDYNSSNTRQLDVAGMKELLLELPFIRGTIAGEAPDPDV
ncbi:polysaccharide biosynthesis protein [Maritimibacter dapengensis]|uniref:UDP-glucose 4-epimerase n=1 Tax=Maritimibacter dapengensis TaxID=2836868 RepID=A0ABS6SYA8_9RHOB|nr:polysaccharide biosynthesis protein [Maritimibacter dapengensis]MBV7377950.1 polysaccharide biosynthesis protein [Maritimibacter dapengensis]